MTISIDGPLVSLLDFSPTLRGVCTADSQGLL